MSKLRPECGTGSNQPCPSKETALLMVYTAVESQAGLAHGRLHDGRGHHCALGSYWEANPKMAFPGDLTDEIAAVNDSVPHYTRAERKAHVMRWLKWQLQKRGFQFKGRKLKSA